MSAPGKINFSRPVADNLHAVISGAWKIGGKPPSVDEVVLQLEAASQVKNLVNDADEVTGGDSGLLTFLISG